MKKYFLFLFFVILLSSFTYGALNDTIRHYYSYEDDARDIFGSINGTESGDEITHIPNCGLLDGCYYYGGSDDYIHYDTSNIIDELVIPLSYNIWVQGNASASYETLFSEGCSSTDACIFSVRENADSDGKPSVFLRDQVSSVKINEIESSLVALDDTWHMVTFTFNTTGTDTWKLYVDCEIGASGTFSGGLWNLFNRVQTGVLRYSTPNHDFTGLLDEFGQWDKTLHKNEICGLKDMINKTGCNPVNNVTCSPPPTPTGANTTNTSLFMAEFEQPDLTFSSSTYFDAFSLEFNTTAERNLTFLSAFNVQKLTVPTQSLIYGKVFVDGNELLEERLRSVSSVNNIGSTGFNPVGFNISSGNHNITIQFRRTGSGNIFVSDFDLVLLEFVSNESNNIRNQLTVAEFTHSDNTFVNAYNWSIVNAVNNTFVLGKLTVNATGESTPYYSFEHLDDGENGIFAGRYLQDSDSVGTLFNVFAHEDGIQQNWSILGYTDSGTVSVNATLLDFDFEDSGNNTINFFISSNISSNFSNNYTLSAGTTKILSQNYTMFHGEGLFITGSTTLRSLTGEQDITLLVNSSNSSLNCDMTKSRTLNSNNDLGNMYLFGFCGGNLTNSSNFMIDMYIQVDTGEEIQVIDESLTGIESLLLDVETITFPTTMGLFMNATNNSIRVQNSFIPFNYSFTVGSGNAFNIANCSLLVDGTVNETQINRNASTDYLFNYSTGIQENDLEFSIRCISSENTNTTQSFLYRIDTQIPRIDTDFVNLSNIEKDDTVTFNFNCTDNNILAYNITWFDVNDDILLNRFATNLTGNNASNTSSRIATETGNNFYIRGVCWDDHNPLPINKKVRKMEWYFDNNNLIADDDITFTGNFKEEKSYFYLSENKYKLKLTFNKTSNYHNIIMSTSGDLIFREGSPYKGHFIYFPKKRFIDFEGDNIDYLFIERISNNIYDIDIHLKENSDEIELESIGDLNVNSGVWYYDVIDTSGIQNLTGIENQLESIGEGLNMIAFIILFVANWILYILILTAFREIDLLKFVNVVLFIVLWGVFIGLNNILMYGSILGAILSVLEIYDDERE